jgi:isoquinoline 1-oxidoreductase alpha subunit
MINLTVNGEAREFSGETDMPLLWYLRDLLGLTGAKLGCGMGLCGACTVHLDGKAIRSCSVTMENLEGASITTIEGLGGDGDHFLQVAWRHANVPQCGFCQPGQIMQAASLLEEIPLPTDEQIDGAMSGVICRCGTYQRIREAIKAAAEDQI